MISMRDVVERPKVMAVVVPQMAQSLDVSGLVDVFLEANRLAAVSLYDVQLISMTDGREVSIGGCP
ncbi:hypothetical protein [Rhizobium giardinii]|uniref:Transcriptional regulator GlxA family with amidase domain n=1 Tax=Rhizobium giardinii TaxID=56731 RepID=A0A7W8UA90_9HYPH|nr:hypothetical protein [Rhizobium giardinii]MBB5535583.1 transcriptional regulator GlxA family with amidase domain [Rhizobium giardinii]